MATAKPGVRRCAIYTRKSSDEGLEQDFNSLHAQREACESFIRSQKSEGWRLIDTAYDDGGLSGGTMERPALQRLLADIDRGLVDTVVVYKVDRLTRSLMDFAKIVERFDRSGVSFVAVTQQFNTTTSMGRLTLNILLSFAQFEREIAGERIRDKIAASKRKGMWMGGTVPLGYDVQDRKLVVNPAEAETARLIYRRYLELGGVRQLKDDLDRRSIRSKVRISSKTGPWGGAKFGRGALYALLSNPLYIGEIAHKGSRYPGQHEAIVEREVWERVQQQLGGRAGRRRQLPAGTSPLPLTGKLVDEDGERLSPTYAMKKGRRYSYYVSRSLLSGEPDTRNGWRLPARQIEETVAHGIVDLLDDRSELIRVMGEAASNADRLSALFDASAGLRERLMSEVERGDALRDLVVRVGLEREQLRMTISLAPLLGAGALTAKDLEVEYAVPLQVRRRGVETRLLIGERVADATPPDSILIKELARARRCFDGLLSGNAKNLSALAAREGVSDRYISSLLPLAFLAPEIVERILAGQQPPELTAHKLIRRAELPIDWSSQKQALGIR
jgi:site-specific DNA recombinase